MKEMYLSYRNSLSKRKKITLFILLIFFIGLTIGSFYITILNESEKTLIIKKVASFFKLNSKIEFSDKLLLFKNSLFSNLIFFIILWFLGLSVIGIPITIIMLFFKGFVCGFSISSIIACYKLKGIIAVILYIFPSTIILSLFTIFLCDFSFKISLSILDNAMHKKSLNFNTFMGKYFFIFMIMILLSIICALFDGFISPHILNLFTNFIK